MGNCFGSCFYHPNPSSTIPRNTIPGTSGYNNSSHAVDLSATSNSNVRRSQSSEVGSEGVGDKESKIKGQTLEIPDLKGFCYLELKIATQNFSPAAFLGRGVLGNTYKGHPSIKPLSLDLRLKIIIGAAQFLPFLHSIEKKVIHRDFTATNMLLDQDYNAKVKNFGITKLASSDRGSHVTTRIVRTYRYAAPDYLVNRTRRVMFMDSVFCYWKTLSRLPVMHVMRQTSLFDWMNNLGEQPEVTMNAQIEGHYSSEAASMATKLTLRCLQRDPKRPPSMKEVVEVLEEVQKIIPSSPLHSRHHVYKSLAR